MKVAVIEDEKPAARLLCGMLRELRPGWEVLFVAGSIKGAVAWFETNVHPDLIFLDIHLSDGDGFTFLEKVRTPAPVVFTTAYDEYALRAFSANGIDYLLKPVRKERLEAALQKIESLGAVHANGDGGGIPVTRVSEPGSSERRYRSRFLISAANGMLSLPVCDIAYFHSMQKISFAVTKKGEEFSLDLSLDRIGEQLDPSRFFRTNRQTIVQIDAVVGVEPYFNHRIVVHTRPAHSGKIVVSREKAAAFKRWLDY